MDAFATDSSSKVHDENIETNNWFEGLHLRPLIGILCRPYETSFHISVVGSRMQAFLVIFSKSNCRFTLRARTYLFQNIHLFLMDISPFHRRDGIYIHKGGLGRKWFLMETSTLAADYLIGREIQFGRPHSLFRFSLNKYRRCFWIHYWHSFSFLPSLPWGWRGYSS